MKAEGSVPPDDHTADLQRLSDLVTKAEADVIAAMARQDAIAGEPYETPEQAADIERRVNEMEDEIALLQAARDEAEDEFNRAVSWDDDDDDGDGDGESLSLEDAANIWLSKGMDEHYTFGYTDEELRRETGLD